MVVNDDFFRACDSLSACTTGTYSYAVPPIQEEAAMLIARLVFARSRCRPGRRAQPGRQSPAKLRMGWTSYVKMPALTPGSSSMM